jgi:hypothetical protein
MRLGHVHRAGTLGLSLVMAIIGVALLGEAVAGVGSVSVRLLAGALFLAGGIGRTYVEVRRGAGVTQPRTEEGAGPDPGAGGDGRASADDRAADGDPSRIAGRDDGAVGRARRRPGGRTRAHRRGTRR